MTRTTSGSERIDPIPDTAALTAGDTLVLGDIHLGLEIELAERGLHGVEISNNLIDDIVALAEGLSVGRVVLLGDVKNGVPRYGSREAYFVRRLVRSLLDIADEVHIVKGNHDGGIESMVPDATVHGPAGAVIDGVGYIHGHARPSEDVLGCPTIVTGHIHPAVCLGGRKDRCWLRQSNGKEFIVLPAFNPHMAGICVNRSDVTRRSPMLRHDTPDIGGFKVYTLSGVLLGTVAELAEQG